MAHHLRNKKKDNPARASDRPPPKKQRKNWKSDPSLLPLSPPSIHLPPDHVSFASFYLYSESLLHDTHPPRPNGLPPRPLVEPILPACLLCDRPSTPHHSIF
mmetsp:Transcript_26695/g.86448  ORF Transcript_26695/g.86448 Transcript_26695/m.86448 type:complete len:102 (-) Transcript_26695:153-458(-)